eukprot:g4732.t1
MGAVHANVRSAIESIGEETNEAQRILPQVASAMYRNKAAILAAVAPELHPVFFAALSLLHLAPKRVGYHVEESSERFVEAVFMVNATMKNYFLYEPFLSKGERKIVAMWDDKKQFKLQSRRKRAAQVDRVLEDHRSFVDDVEGLVKRTAGAESRAVDAPVPGAGGQQRGQLELVAGPPMQFEPEPREVARSKTSSADTGTSEGGKKEEDVALDTMMKELWEIRRSSPTEPGSNPLLLNKNGKSPLSAAAAAVRAGAPTFVHPAPSTKHVDSLIASARDYNASKGSVAASTPMEAAPAVQQVRLSPKEGPYP